jgi:hypothetical protein
MHGYALIDLKVGQLDRDNPLNPGDILNSRITRARSSRNMLISLPASSTCTASA